MRPEIEVAKLIVSCDSQVVKEVELDKERMTLGRKAHNDIVVDHKAVSGQHASILVMHDDAILEDLGSTNGTFVNGQKVYRHKLVHGDKIVVATYEMEYLATPPKPARSGWIEVGSGAHAGKKLPLTKPLTTVGKPGTAVVAISFASGTYFASNIEGETGAQVNGSSLSGAPLRLEHGDVINLAGTHMTFHAR